MNKRNPCEILSDLMTLYEIKGNLEEQKIVFVGEGANISNTWFQVEFKPYQIKLDKLKICNQGCIVNPCPPFTRGNENLLHMQKAILARLR